MTLPLSGVFPGLITALFIRSYLFGMSGLVFKAPGLNFEMTSKCENSDACDAEAPRGGRPVSASCRRRGERSGLTKEGKAGAQVAQIHRRADLRADLLSAKL